MEPMCFSSNKVDSSQKEAWRSSKCLSHQNRHLLLILWVSLKREDARNSLKQFKISNKVIPKPMTESKLTNQVSKCFKNMNFRKIQLILLVMLLLFTQMIASCIGLQLNWSEKYNSIWILWEKILLLSFILSMVWAVFLKVFQESVL